MHLAVLMTNTDESAFAETYPKDGEKFARLIALVRPSWKVTSFAVKDDVFPDDISAFDGLMITGSPASVHDGYAWIDRLLDVIRDADLRGMPMFGACFGHQAIALALGGVVEKNPVGWTFGAVEMAALGTPDWYSGPSEFTQYAAHIEHVTKLPQGANAIFETPNCKVAGFVKGPNIYTTQNHPEMTPEFIAALTDELADYLGQDVTKTAKSSLTTPVDMHAFAETIATFFEAAR